MGLVKRKAENRNLWRGMVANLRIDHLDMTSKRCIWRTSGGQLQSSVIQLTELIINENSIVYVHLSSTKGIRASGLSKMVLDDDDCLHLDSSPSAHHPNKHLLRPRSLICNTACRNIIFLLSYIIIVPKVFEASFLLKIDKESMEGTCLQ